MSDWPVQLELPEFLKNYGTHLFASLRVSRGVERVKVSLPKNPLPALKDREMRYHYSVNFLN